MYFYKFSNNQTKIHNFTKTLQESSLSHDSSDKIGEVEKLSVTKNEKKQEKTVTKKHTKYKKMYTKIIFWCKDENKKQKKSNCSHKEIKDVPLQKHCFEYILWC